MHAFPVCYLRKLLCYCVVYPHAYGRFVKRFISCYATAATVIKCDCYLSIYSSFGVLQPCTMPPIGTVIEFIGQICTYPNQTNKFRVETVVGAHQRYVVGILAPSYSIKLLPSTVVFIRPSAIVGLLMCFNLQFSQ